MQLLVEDYGPVVEVAVAAAAAAAAAAVAYDSGAGSLLFVALEPSVYFHCTLCVMHFVMVKILLCSLTVSRDAEFVMAVDQDVTLELLWFSGRQS
jgi:hypothetical protein